MINRFFFILGFKHCGWYHSVYVVHVNGDDFIVTLYVDHLFIIGGTTNLTLGLRKLLTYTFELANLGS